MFEQKNVWQIGIIVEDMEKAVTRFMEVLNIQETPLYNEVGRGLSDFDCKTVHRGDVSSKASCYTCCFQMGNVEIEYIQPYGDYPSEWKRFLDEKGPGIHHLGWKTKDPDAVSVHFKKLGYDKVQSGSWGEGEYNYFDTLPDLGFAIEILKFY